MAKLQRAAVWARVVVALATLAAITFMVRRGITTRVPAGSLPTQLTWVVEHARESRAFSGAIVLARGGRILFAQTAGLADSSAKRPNQLITPFPLASVTKPLTAILVAQLIAEGRLALADSLAGIFPPLAGTAAGRITIEQLLTHRSGIEEVISRNPQRRITPDDLRTARVEPTTSYTYSNTGYVCLALVIEAVTDLPYATVVGERVFARAGMKQSGVLRANADLRGLASGDRGTRAPTNIGAAPDALDGAGSLYASAADLVRLDRALASGELVAADVQARLTKANSDASGWMSGEQDGRAYSWHSGNLPGYSTYLARIPARDEVLVILSNQSDVDVRGLAKQLLYVSKRHP